MSRISIISTVRSLLSLMLSDRSQKYDTKVKMNQKLDKMFGATLNSSVSNYGQAHVLDISLGVLNEKFVKSDLLNDQINLLHQLIYHPLLNNSVFNEAKQVLKDMLLRETDNLSSYTTKQALRVAGKGFPLEYNRLGNLKELENVTLKDVEAEMQSLLINDVLDIIVIGDVEEVYTKALLNKRFVDNNTNHNFESNYLVKTKEVSEVLEKRDTQQAYLTIVYNTNTLNVNIEYWALQLMSMILGGLPNSFLFQEVREKRSLCYSIRSTVRGYDGIMYISAGVRLDSIDEAINLSIKQVKRLLKDEFSDELFESAKSMLVDSIYKTDDSNRRMVDSQYRKIILDEDINTKELVALVNSIKRSQIVDAANKLELNTIYRLVREDENA